MVSNFRVQKSTRTFKPQGSGSDDVGIVRTVAGGYEPMQHIQVVKADQPVEATARTPHTDGEGRRELNIHADNVDRNLPKSFGKASRA
jgi:hypothetical protein